MLNENEIQATLTRVREVLTNLGKTNDPADEQLYRWTTLLALCDELTESDSENTFNSALR